MSYVIARHIHIACVILSGGLFMLRGVWTWRQTTILRRRWMRRLPHAIDTVLLATALVLVASSGQYPIAESWLTAKVLVLVGYIVLGWIALKSERPPRVRIWAFFGALAAFAYIVGVAITKNIAIVA